MTTIEQPVLYEEFLHRKAQLGGWHGFEAAELPTYLYDFQAALVDWSLRKGRAAIFADCGLGKTPMQLAWAEQIVRRTNGRVLIVTPLAVAWQTIREAAKFGIEVGYSRDGKPHGDITVTNYEQLHHFEASDFAGAVCDESSAIKNFDGVRRQVVTAFLRKMKYRLLATATAAPNDYTELGTSSDALGYLGHTDMLSRFFVNDQNNSVKGMRYRWSKDGTYGRVTWRFKGHAEDPFWRWVCSWARAMRKPSDLGYDDSAFVLPPLQHRLHVVQARTRLEGTLFELPAVGMVEEREERRRTLRERCEMVADLVTGDERAAVWCDLNAEGDLLTRLIPGAVQVKGSDSAEAKEEALVGFTKGDIRVLVTKPKIGAWGLNWQHVAHMTFFPGHSYEQYYQSIRRMWRFGQTRPVVVDIVTTEGSRRALENLERKAAAVDRMFDRLVEHMRDALDIERSKDGDLAVVAPAWLA